MINSSSKYGEETLYVFPHELIVIRQKDSKAFNTNKKYFICYLCLFNLIFVSLLPPSANSEQSAESSAHKITLWRPSLNPSRVKNIKIWTRVIMVSYVLSSGFLADDSSFELVVMVFGCWRVFWEFVWELLALDWHRYRFHSMHSV